MPLRTLHREYVLAIVQYLTADSWFSLYCVWPVMSCDQHSYQVRVPRPAHPLHAPFRPHLTVKPDSVKVSDSSMGSTSPQRAGEARVGRFQAARHGPLMISAEPTPRIKCEGL